MANSFAVSRWNWNIHQNADKTFSHVKQVLKLLQKAEITIKLKNCRFFTNTVNCFKHKHRLWWLQIALYTIDKIKELEELRNVTELGSFLDLCNVIRRFGPSFTLIAGPLNRKLDKNHPWEFDPYMMNNRVQ